MIRFGGFLLLYVVIFCFSGRIVLIIDKILYMNLEFLNIVEGIFDMVVLGKLFCKLYGFIFFKIIFMRNKISYDF